MCKGQSSSRGSGLLLFNKLNCCLSQLSMNTKNSIPLRQSGLGNVMKTKANQWQNRQLTERGKSYNTTPENSARRKARLCLESARLKLRDYKHCGCFMLHFQAYDDTFLTILKGPLGGIFFCFNTIVNFAGFVITVLVTEFLV